jgi:RHS repeat-associated protein
MAGNSLYHINADGGPRRSLMNVAGHPIRTWDARGHAFRLVYDPAQRPRQRYVSTAGAKEILLELSIYGEGQATANLCGRVFRHYDAAGYIENSLYDFKGNLLSNIQQLALAYRQASDWTPLASLTTAGQLDAAATSSGLVPTGDGGRDRFAASTAYDALNRPIQVVSAHNATMLPDIQRPAYDVGGRLAQVDVWLQQSAAPAGLLDPSTADRHAVTGIDYDARGQKLSVSFGNGTKCAYTYDPQTFRLLQITTTRPGTFAANLRTVQALSYYYDPVGNITNLRDDADTQNVIFFRNQRIEPSASYTYDPIYQLIAATGREHLGQTGAVLNPPRQITNDDSFHISITPPGDGNLMGVYSEVYSYSEVGNLLAVIHQANSASWTRRYSYVEASQITVVEKDNRLSATSLPGDLPSGPFSATYAYDAHGNMTQMPHLPALVWDEDDRLRSTTRQVVNSGTPETSYYVYDPDGQRVRKLTDRQAGSGQSTSLKVECIYLGNIEIYREYAVDGTMSLGRETLTLDVACAALVRIESRTLGSDPAPAQQVRYQLSNHLGSAILELSDQSEIISYEEFFPFGSTSYQAVASQTDVAKRYRYSGKERDSENDLYYHGARYYSPWLGRWTACDPKGIKAGLNLFSYVRNSPTCNVDPHGTDDQPGWLASHLGPSSPVGQWISHADYPGSSFIQDDRKLAAAQHVAEVTTVVAASVATGGFAAEAAGGYVAAAGGTTLETTVLSGAVFNVVSGATERYGTTGIATGSVSDSLKSAADPGAIATDAIEGAATGALLHGVARAGRAWGNRSASSARFSPPKGLQPAPSGPKLLPPGPPAPKLLPPGPSQPKLLSPAPPASSPKSVVAELQEIASKATPATPAQEAVISEAKRLGGGSSRASGTALHELTGAAPRGVDFQRSGGALHEELKSHWTGIITKEQLRSASQQSLGYSLKQQAQFGTTPIRIVRHVYVDPSGGPSLVLKWH